MVLRAIQYPTVSKGRGPLNLLHPLLREKRGNFKNEGFRKARCFGNSIEDSDEGAVARLAEFPLGSKLPKNRL